MAQAEKSRLSRIRLPRVVDTSYEARQVAKAYNYPLQFTGKGYTCGIIELGGGFTQSDLKNYFVERGLPVPSVTAVSVGGASNSPGSPDGADGEVMLDIEVAASVAPGASYRVYFAPNTDSGFLSAVNRAIDDGVTTISISWGGPESDWNPKVLDAFDKAFLRARIAGVVVFCAAGDNGSSDGTEGSQVDFPSSSPNVIACGGTRLILDSKGKRASETVWNDNPYSSATGGGVSQHWPGYQVPTVAGNADPETGWRIEVDGLPSVVGGTSAVAPLYAALTLLLSEGCGEAVGKRVDFMNTLLTNPDVCFDGSRWCFSASSDRERRRPRYSGEGMASYGG